MLKCTECRQECGRDSIRFVGDKPICLDCLYGSVDPVGIGPIGFVVKDKKRAKDGVHLIGGGVSEIRLSPGMARFMIRSG